jgi:hypothetical protein
MSSFNVEYFLGLMNDAGNTLQVFVVINHQVQLNYKALANSSKIQMAFQFRSVETLDIANCHTHTPTLRWRIELNAIGHLHSWSTSW